MKAELCDTYTKSYSKVNVMGKRKYSGERGWIYLQMTSQLHRESVVLANGYAVGAKKAD